MLSDKLLLKYNLDDADTDQMLQIIETIYFKDPASLEQIIITQCFKPNTYLIEQQSLRFLENNKDRRDHEIVAGTQKFIVKTVTDQTHCYHDRHFSYCHIVIVHKVL